MFGVPNFQMFRFQDFQTPAVAAAIAAATTDKLSDPNLTPLPTHPGIKYVARSPCCDHSLLTVISKPIKYKRI